VDTSRFNSWVEISEADFRANLKCVRHVIGQRVRLSLVVKANAYGHGLREIAGLANKYGENMFCVHSIDEAHELQESVPAAQLLIIGPIGHERLPEAISQGMEFGVFSAASISEVNAIAERVGKSAKIHLKLETGMNRYGVTSEELAFCLDRIVRCPGIRLRGLYTHFSNGDQPGENDHLAQQVKRFHRGVAELRRRQFRNVIKHAANSAALFNFSRAHFDMVRVGLSQYGLWPSFHTERGNEHRRIGKQRAKLRPVLAWKTRLTQVKRVPRGEHVGYGCTYRTTRDTTLGVLPIGYADGYDRGLSNAGYVLVRGKCAKVVGRVCMNATIIDITEVAGARSGDEVVLLGRQGEQCVSADFLAKLLNTINYEVVTRINWTIPRIVV
jgi:alanine racemase